MAKEILKGALLQIEIATIATTVAQLIEFTPPSIESEDFDSPTLDQAGVFMPRDLTGYADSTGFDALIYWDPSLAVQQAITGDITTPKKTVWQVIYANAGATEIDWTCAKLKFAPSGGKGDGLQARITGNVDGAAVITP